MILTLQKKAQSISNYAIEWDLNGQAIAWSNEPSVLLWKFIDENGNLWNTETAIDGTEDQARAIILGSMQ